ncbi:MFS transporter [Dactylosporangium sp. NPDC051484]|uniref:MFS transporter n=1 Tax=Dactylosporangium sp. NPDC051484 TaxID=3154942 RepID=UPI00344F98E4
MSERGQSSTATRAAGGEPAAPHPPRKALILGIILTCQLMVVLDVTIVNIALPRVEQDLSFSAAGGAWVLNGYTLAFGGLLLMAGRAGDAFGRRRILLAGITLFTIASLVGGVAPAAGVLIAARVAQGVGAALTAPSVLALLASNFSEGAERNKALGTFSMVLGLGLTLGFVLGGALASASWRWVFFVNVPFGAIAVVLILLYLRETERHQARFDTVGALLSTAGMVALVYALIHAASDGWSNGVTIGGLVLGVVLLVAFVAVERGTGAPIMPLRLVTERNRAAAYLNNLLLPAATTGMLFLLSQYMQEVHGYGPLRTGVAFLPQAAAQFIAARTAPKLVPKLGAKRLTLLGTALVLVAAAWLSQVGADSAYPVHLLGPLILLGAGLGMSFMPLTMTVLAGLPPAESGAASGLLQAMQQMGVSLGVAVLITVYGSVVRGAAPDGVQRTLQAHGFADAFGTAAVLAAAALLVAAIVIQTRKPAPAKA